MEEDEAAVGGGEGGEGGEGGSGGDGGDGGKGAAGSDGGHGAYGGEGGRGGDGGGGGNGGRGGSCVIRASDPRLLVLVEPDCRSGSPGVGGGRGRGGKGGVAGYGGMGGEAVSGSYTGIQGKPGMSGVSGEHGTPGQPGLTPNPGSMQWIITSPEGHVEYSASTRYDAEVRSLEVSSYTVSGVFEPYQEVKVANVVVVNSGGLPLPAGAKLSIPSTDSVHFESASYKLPRLDPDEEFTVPVNFRGRITDEPSPNLPGPLTRTCRFSTRIDMLGRPFEKSRLEKTLTVQYPIKLEYVLADKDVSQGAVTTLEVGIQNATSVPYGTSEGSLGSVLVHILLDPSLTPLGLGSEHHSEGLSDTSEPRPYTAKRDPNHANSVYVQVKDIQPGSTLSIPLVVQLDRDAELYRICRWQAEVYYREKLIEYKFSEIRVAPKYITGDIPVQLADVVLIKTDDLYLEEMAFWQRIFEVLGVSFDCWDANYFKISDDESTSTDQVNRFLPPFRLYDRKLVVFPHCDTTRVSARDIVSHFHSETKKGTPEVSESSMLLFLNSPPSDCLKDYVQKNEATKKVLRYLCHNEEKIRIPPELYSGWHLLSPGTILPPEWTLSKAQKQVIKRLEQLSPSQAPVLLEHSNVIRKQGTLYSYGTLDVRRCPISRSCNLQIVDGSVSQTINMGMDDPHLSFTSKEAPLASHFGQVFLATLAGLPMRCKLALLGQPHSTTSSLSMIFHLPNDTSLSKQELAAICLANDIADQVYTGMTDLQKMHTLKKYIEGQPNKPVDNILLLSQLLDLIKREATNRRQAFGKNSSQVSQAVKELLFLCSSACQLLSSPSSNPPLLPRLSQLQSHLSVLRPHQITSDTLFDISN